MQLLYFTIFLTLKTVLRKSMLYALVQIELPSCGRLLKQTFGHWKRLDRYPSPMTCWAICPPAFHKPLYLKTLKWLTLLKGKISNIPNLQIEKISDWYYLEKGTVRANMFYLPGNIQSLSKPSSWWQEGKSLLSSFLCLSWTCSATLSHLARLRSGLSSVIQMWYSTHV